jgi:hypothetical protein
MSQRDAARDEPEVVLSVDPGGHMHVDRESLPVIPSGQPLIEHEVYIDTGIRGHGPFRALSGQVGGSGNAYVAEKDVTPAIWDLLVREDGEERLHHEVGESESTLPEGHLSELGSAV